MSDCQFERDRIHYRFCEPTSSSCEIRLFDDDWVTQQGRIVRTINHGRNRVQIFNHMQSTLVCRHYNRGGIIRHLSTDRYLWAGLQATRAWREFDVLLRLQSFDLPAPEPYASRVVPMLPGYQASLITRYLAATKTLAETLHKCEISDQQWFDVGCCVRRFHDVGLDHSDLNANNILLDEQGRIFLIDFDKARFRTGTRTSAGRLWKKRNLKRLQRSIIKGCRKATVFHYKPTNWDYFRDGYFESN